MKVVLISCSKTKIATLPGQKVCAKDLYNGTFFKKALEYAERELRPNRIYILSAKHHLLELTDKIETYDEYLGNKPASVVRKWGEKVIDQLKAKGVDLDKDTIIFLAGEKYYKYYIDKIKIHETPLKGLKIGKILQELNNLLYDDEKF